MERVTSVVIVMALVVVAAFAGSVIYIVFQAVTNG